MDSLTEKNNAHLVNMLSSEKNKYPGFERNLSTSQIFALVLTLKSNYPIIYSSKLFSSLGYSADSELTLRDIVSEEDFNFLSFLINRSISICHNSFCCELNLKYSNNKLMYYLCNFQIIRQNNAPVAIECIMMDVNSIKNDSVELHRHLDILSKPDFVFVEGPVSDNFIMCPDFVSYNCSFYSLMKYKFRGSKINLVNVIHPDDRDQFIKKLNFYYKRKGSFTEAVRLINPYNKVFWIMIEVSFIVCNDGQCLVNILLHNINNLVDLISQMTIKQKILTSNLRQSELISDVLKHLQVTEDYETAIHIILQKLCEYIDASEISFVIPSGKHDNVDVFKYTLADSNFNIIRASKSCLNKYKNITKKLNKYGIAYKDSINCSKGCEKEFESIKVNACLVFKVSTAQSNCYINCIDNAKNRIWNSETVSIFTDISQVISGLFHRILITKELNITKGTLATVLDNIDSLVFVSSLESNIIIYSNKKFVDTFGNDTNGKHIWDIINIEESKYIQSSFNKHNSSKRFYEIYCPDLKLWFDVTEVNLLWHDGNIVRLSTMNDISQKIEYEKLIEIQAMTDHLTGLPNRRMLEKDFPKFLKEAEEAKSFGYILFLDLDNFKNINDGLGHTYGDVLLEDIGCFLMKIPGAEKSCYRFGGDEFVILISHKDSDKINSIMDTIYDKFQKKWTIFGVDCFCTSSIGVARFPYDGYDLTDIMKKVDMAMYNAKKLGKNRIMHYKTKIGSESIRSIEIERYLREAVTNNFYGLEVFYQPIVNTKTRKIVSAEALLRWHSSNYGNIGPSEFIPLAENSGLIRQIGEFVIRNACKECKNVIDSGFKDFVININLSVLQLSEVNIVSAIKKAIKDTGIPYRNIGLEVTEGIAVTDMQNTRKILNELSALGIKILLDDFGTGFSSLNYIKDMPFDTIKIDKSFIDDLLDNSKTEVFISTIISLSHALNMKVCAEGVEQEVQYNKLHMLNADNIQGYYFSKPVPSDEFSKMIGNTYSKHIPEEVI